MVDYSKLTVNNLKALLKTRSIALTGLTRKAQLIERLERDDSENASATPEADAQLDDNDDAEPEAHEASPENHPAPDTARDEETLRKSEDGDVAPRTDGERTPNQTSLDALDGATDDKAADPASDGKDDQPTASAETNAPEAVEAPEAEEESQEAPPSAEPPTQQSLSPKLETSRQAEDQASLATKESPPVASSDLPKEESKTRKRRSVSPPIDVETTRKRLRLDEEHVPGVHLKEDGSVPEVDMQDAAPAGLGDERTSSTENPEATGEASNLRDEGEPKETASAEPDDSKKREATDQSAVERIERAHDDGENKHEVASQEETPRQRSASPKPHRETRYQSLFPPAGEPISRPSALPEAVEDDDRAISPALHPATRGLYIRDFMRPLQPALLKNHLISIASPPSSSSPDPQVLELFHLDPIRTHVLALFDSITAAARVRSSLHEAVWPPERTRKPLWADFVPDDKVSEWIEREERESGGSSRMGKRWEVVYEPADVDGGVLASHREVGAPSSLQQPPPPREPAGTASPPRGGAGRLPPPESPTSSTRKAAAAAPSGPATEKSFVALDKLFGSTAAKPKLYFLPVADDLAARRLEELRRCSSRNWRPSDRPGAGAERRYTFDDGDVLTDAGPDAEVGQIRGRGAVRYRGGGGPGGPYGGGGGGGRGRDRGWGPQTGMGGPPPETFGRRRW
ncbi:uncharacterized protein J3D65DRAFT_610180 [Phyllosticta citribraziliensis]|uniref:SAP domain-containing protein n=1 Tax=Phyllosticta citribraziliensis TaxID=989973 RepID=A0ABR1M9T4_9PEZI